MMTSFFQLRSAMIHQIGAGPTEIDVLSWMGRVGLELIGQCGLGYSFDPLLEVRQDPLGEAIKGLMSVRSVWLHVETDDLDCSPYTYALHFWRTLSPYWTKIGTPGFRRYVSKLLPTKDMQAMRNVVETLQAKSSEIYMQKKAALEKGDDAMTHQIGEGKDILSVLSKDLFGWSSTG